ncbi:unnamed protein product [Sphagnum troendelagicum]|uniref:Dual specificity protein phosphatase DSP8 n=1 Tax=Sphagnum troendelagicum TaxID=128251 RepID=A0ABP0TLQ5_9BRYO
MIEEVAEEGNQEKVGWTIIPRSGEDLRNVEITAKRAVVGAGARVLFYPTLLYNVVRNKLQPEFQWWDQIDQYLLLGAVPFPSDVVRLKDLGVQAVVTLNESYETLVPTAVYQGHGIDHLVIPTRDYYFAPSFTKIRNAVKFIHDHAQRRETTYVHCKAGRGRSTTVVLCYLVEHRGMTPVDAYQYVRARRPRVLLATAQWLAVQEYSRRIHGVIMAQSLPIVSEPSSLIPSSTTETPSAKYIRNSNDNMGGLNFADDLPVLVTNADLAGYQGIQDAGLVGNQIWHDLGVVYRVRFIATRRVVNAMSVARASAAWARFSCVWLGCQAENVVLGASMRLDQLSSSEVISHASIGLPSTCLGRMNFSGLNLPVCQSGIVNG